MAASSRDPTPRKGMPSVKLGAAEFRRRFLSAFIDPAFDRLQDELARIADAAWEGYSEGRKAPRTRKAGQGFADPDYELSVDWIAARDAVAAAQARHDGAGPSRILIINASPRSEHTCPGEMSKTFRLAKIADDIVRKERDFAVSLLDLSSLASEYGRNIHPCKACFSTSPALCHWPCSCYPNYALGQTRDWMNEIYPLWVEAHGVLIVAPVHWLSATSPLKLMMDRLVCADGGNPDPTRTHGKKAAEAKAIELEGWDYPKHLKDRLFGLVVHGDVEGAKAVKNSLEDWLTAMELIPAGSSAIIDRYVGYYEPYATSHEALDGDQALMEETRNAARTLVEAVRAQRSGQLVAAGRSLKSPRQK